MNAAAGRRTRRLRRGAACALALLAATAARADSGGDPAELARTWAAAWVFVPSAASAGYRRTTTARLPALLAGRAHALPVVVYAHGCDGLNGIAAQTARFLSRGGYLVVEPDSFARRHKPVSCIPARHRGGLHRAVLGWRQAEVRYAVEHVRGLPEVRGDALFLMGLSEGGITVATLPDAGAAGRVIEGWTCHAGWPEYRGLRAPPGQPVLALVSADDPWFRLPVLRGDCGDFMHGRAGGRSIVYRTPSYLHDRHWLSVDPDVQRVIVDFLTAHTPARTTDAQRATPNAEGETRKLETETRNGARPAPAVHSRRSATTF